MNPDLSNNFSTISVNIGNSSPSTNVITELMSGEGLLQVNSTYAAPSTSLYVTEDPNYKEFCGVPLFCSHNTSTLCIKSSLNQCDACSMWRAGIFIVSCVLVDLLIVFANAMVIAVVLRSGLKDGFSKMKVSLAVADGLTGKVTIVNSTFVDLYFFFYFETSYKWKIVCRRDNA